MRALKTVLIIILALIVILGSLAYVGPERSVVQRSVVIDASPEVIYPMIASLRSQHTWSAWGEMDQGQRNEWLGADASVGSKQKWEGDTVGRGSQEIIAMEPNTSVTTKLSLQEPMGFTSELDLRLSPQDEATRVDWVLTKTNDGMDRIMAVFVDLEKWVAPDLEKGLKNLKGKAEQEQQAITDALIAKTHRGYVIETVEQPARTYIGKRAKVKFAELEKFFASTFGSAYAAVTTQGISPAGHPTAIYFEWDDVKQVTDVMAAIPVEAPEEVEVKGQTTYTVPAAKMLFIPYYGSYEKSMDAHQAMAEMIQANDLVHYGNVLEEYVTDPMEEPDTTKWLTNIYYMVR